MVLALSLLLGVTALAEGFDDFPDGNGHWAEAALRRAVEEGLVNGVDGKLEPDSPATLAQLLTILSRMLEPAKSVTAESVGLTGTNWYDPYVLSAASLGIDFDVEKLERGELTRGAAALVLADAFKLIPTEPDESVLSSFTDRSLLAGHQRQAMAALVARGVVNGATATTLEPNKPLTRAELFTMLFRIVGKTADSAQTDAEGGLLVTKDGDLAGKTITGEVWLGGSCKSIDLTGTKAGTLVVLSQVSGIKTDKDTRIKHLILAGGKSDELEISGTIDTLTLDDGAPKAINVTGEVKHLELKGGDVELTISTALETLSISGTDCVVVDTKDADTVEVAGEGNSLTVGGKVNALTVGGSDNTVTGQSRGKAETVTIASHTAQCDLPGEQRVSYDLFADLDMDFSAKKFLTIGEDMSATLTLSDPVEQELGVYWLLDGKAFKSEVVTVGPEPITLQASAPADLNSATLTRAMGVMIRSTSSGVRSVTLGQEVYTEGADTAISAADIDLSAAWDETTETISATARITNPISVPATATMYIDGTLVDTRTVTVGPTAIDLSFSSVIEEPATRQYGAEIRLAFSYAGHSSSASKSASVDVVIPVIPEIPEIPEPPKVSAEEALATVTCNYAGDFTLDWALAHDYTKEMKTAWVNAKGYSSQTQYLIWVNRTYQRVNIFEGSQGNWTLIHEFLCGTGKPSTPTPVGEYTVWGYDKGWYHSYWAEPVVRFNTGTGYAFHSRLWNPGHQTLQDSRIGFPISLGCVRMYDEDIQWMYNNIPLNTKVVVY